MLVVVLEENAALPVEAAIGADDEIVGRVVGVRRAGGLQQDDADIGDIIAIGVLEEKDVRLRGHDYAAAPEGEAEGVVDFRELDRLVRHAVAVVVGENEQAVVHFLERLPLRIGRPAGSPEAAFHIDLQLHRIRHGGEPRLVCEKVHCEALGHVDFLETFLAAEIFRTAFLVGIGHRAAAADIRDHRDGFRDVRVIDLVFFTLSHGMDFRIAVGGHHIEHDHFVLEHLGVGLAFDEFESGTPAPDVVFVGGAETVVPVPILVHHCLAQRFHGGCGGNGFSDNGSGDHLAELAVALGKRVDAVESERGFRLHVERLGGAEKIDKRDTFFRGDLFHGLGVEGEVRVVFRAVREIGIAEVLVGDGREQDEARRRFTVELRGAVFVDHRGEVGLEGR